MLKSSRPVPGAPGAARLLLLLSVVVVSAVFRTVIPTGAALAARPAKPQMRFSFSKPFYSEKEPIVFRANISNPTKTPLPGALVQIEFFNRMRLGKDGPLPSESVIHRELLQADILPPGKTRLTTSRKAGEMGLGEGAYPATARLIWQGEEIAKSKTTVVVVNPRLGEPLSVALVWDLHERSHAGPTGVFWDRNLPNKTFGVLGTHLSALKKHRDVQVSANMTPMLVEQIRSISRGYRFVTEDSTRPLELSADSRDARRARLLLDQYGALIDRGSIELIPAPYAYPSLVSLGQRGWTADIKEQIALGWRILPAALGLQGKFTGLYLPGLRLNSASLPVLTSSGIEFTVLDESYFRQAENRTGSQYQPHRLEDADRRRITVFFKNTAHTNVLTQRRGASATMQRLLGALAEVYLSKPGSRRIVVIAPGPEWKPDRRLLELLYSRLEHTRWLSATGLASAASGLPAATQPLQIAETLAAPGYLQNRYYARLGQARIRYRNFASALAPGNPLRARLRATLFVAESSDWTRSGADPRLINLGLKYVRHIDRTADAHYRKVTMPPRQTVTLTGQSGKIPLAIGNSNPFPMKITIRMESHGFDFPGGRRQSVTLRPKENFFTFPVSARAPGTSQVYLSLMSGDEMFARNTMAVKAAYLSRTFWAILFLATAALAALLSWHLWRTGRLRRPGAGEVGGT